MDWLGTECTPNALERISNMKPHNFNVGKVGRGRKLSRAAINRLDEMAERWGPEWGPKIRTNLLEWPDLGAR